MKALMSVGALMGVVGILLLAGMIVGIVPSNTVRLIEGYMPVQVISELTLFVAGFTGLSYMMASMGMALPAVLAGDSFLGVHSPVFEVSCVSADSVQRACHVWDGLPRGHLYVGVCERRRLEEVQAADHECLGCQDWGNKAVALCISDCSADLDRRVLIQRDGPEIRGANRVADGASCATSQHQGAWERPTHFKRRRIPIVSILKENTIRSIATRILWSRAWAA